MKNNMKIFTPVILAILIGSLTFIFAQSKENNGGKFPRGERKFGGQMPPPPPGFGPGGLHPRLLERLNLTDGQKTQIQALHEKARTDAEAYVEKLRAADDELRALIESGSFNETQARQILATKSQIQIELEIIHLRTEAAVLNILTAEQKAQLEQLKKERRPQPPPPPPAQN
jgi:Spy/CpxP family protein refolding chaperone